MSGCDCGTAQAEQLERKTLIALLLINAVMFATELAFGLVAQSTGLIADSLDMLADTGVYGLALYAVGRGLLHQAKAAEASGYLQIILGAGVLIEVFRRLLFGSAPESVLIMSVGAIALLANIVCLALISKHRNGGIHMRASWIFSTNDVIANLGVIVSGALVAVVGSRIPDLIVGAVISAIVVRGGMQILKETRQARA